jgi:hypothetical protein
MFVSQPNNFVYSHPYLLVLIQDSIHIYRYSFSFVLEKRKSNKFVFSYLDDQLKQEIPIKTCRTLINIPRENMNSILITNKDNIYLLESLNIEEQVDQLINNYRLQEALTLAESTCSSIEQRSGNPLLLSTKKRIGLIEFSGMNVIRALNLFDDIQLDFHEIIIHIPDFLPLNSPWPDLDEDNRSKYIQWLTAFCDYMTKRSVEFSRNRVSK